MNDVHSIRHTKKKVIKLTEKVLIEAKTVRRVTTTSTKQQRLSEPTREKLFMMMRKFSINY